MNWSKLSNRIYIVFLLLSCCIYGQNTWQDYKKEYPDFNEIVLNDSQSYDFFVENNKLKIIQDNNFESIILSENGIQNNQEAFSYSELVQLKGYEAFSIVNNNGKEKKIKVTQSNEKQSRQSSIFYNDVKERHLIFPNLESGARKVYQYQTEFLDPFLLHKFIFGGGLPIKNASLEIRTQKNINIGFKIFNDPNNTISFSKTEKKGKWIYKWTLNDIKPVMSESNAPGFLYIIPHIDFYIKDYTIDGKKIDVLDDTQKLFNYYKGFVKNLNQKEDADLKEETLKITENSTSNEDKIKAIFYWVKDNIKYIAFENGYEGFIPREASLVYKRKFGDCKDMASLITDMARYANISNVTIAWIGTRKIPYTYADLATPSVDDHMIAIFKNEGKYIFLDATDKETRFGIPTAFIQGKEALFGETENYKIISVPIVTAQENEIKDELKLTIENDKLVGSGKMQCHGYNRSHILMQIGDATNKTRFELIKSLVLKGNNKFNLKDYWEENLKNRDLPYIINYDFDLNNYMLKVDKELYINLLLDKLFEKMTIEKDRVSKFEFEYLSFINNNYELTIPENYEMEYLPQNFNLDNDLIKVMCSYEKKDNKIILRFQLNQKKLMLDYSDFELWNESIKKLKNTYSESIILKEKK